LEKVKGKKKKWGKDNQSYRGVQHFQMQGGGADQKEVPGARGVIRVGWWGGGVGEGQ